MLPFLLLILYPFPGQGMPDTMLDGKYIIGGKYENISKVPYTAVLLHANRFICGATIISEKYLLTAAHCIRESGENMVRVGSSYREKEGKVYKIKKAVKHPKYGKLDFDMGYLEVEEPIEFNSNVQPIAVVDKEPEQGQTAKISGYGREDQSTLPKQLKSVEMTVVDRQHCEYGSFLTPRMICAVDANRASCPFKGDSGGPIVVNGKVAGAVSWGQVYMPCSMPSAFSSFGNPEIRKFIRDKTGV